MRSDGATRLHAMCSLPTCVHLTPLLPLFNTGQRHSSDCTTDVRHAAAMKTTKSTDCEELDVDSTAASPPPATLVPIIRHTDRISRLSAADAAASTAHGCRIVSTTIRRQRAKRSPNSCLKMFPVIQEAAQNAPFFSKRPVSPAGNRQPIPRILRRQ